MCLRRYTDYLSGLKESEYRSNVPSRPDAGLLTVAGTLRLRRRARRN